MEGRAPGLMLQPWGGSPDTPQVAGVGQGWAGGVVRGRRNNAWGPSSASQGLVGVPRGWLTSQEAAWCPKGLASWLEDTQ